MSHLIQLVRMIHLFESIRIQLNFYSCWHFIIFVLLFYPEHLSQVRITESEGNIGDMKAFGLGFPRPLFLAATSCSPRRQGNVQRLGVRGHWGQTFVLSDGQRDREIRLK